MRKQTPPFSIQIELTEGCNLKCSFCGLQGMRESAIRDYRFMHTDTVARIAEEIYRLGWKPRIILSMHGEPTLHPHVLSHIKTLRRILHENTIISLMTNGYGILRDTAEETLARIRQFRNAGLNDLIIDEYSPHGDAAKIHEHITSSRGAVDFNVKALEKGVSLYSTRPGSFRVLENPPIQVEGAINRHLCNHCGAGGPLDYSYDGKRCVRPFRELSIRYDGNIALCCNDFRGEYPIGNINEAPMDELWYSKRFEAARILLYHGKRSFKPCLGCNALSHRVGLLPDKLGKEVMPQATDRILEYAKNVSVSNKPLGTIIKRKWEV